MAREKQQQQEEPAQEEPVAAAEAQRQAGEESAATEPVAIADNDRIAEAARLGYWGAKREAANANAAPLQPAPGDGDLRAGSNEAAAIRLGPDQVTPGEEVPEGRVIAPSNPVGDEAVPGLDPTNAEQYGNAPSKPE